MSTDRTQFWIALGAVGAFLAGIVALLAFLRPLDPRDGNDGTSTTTHSDTTTSTASSTTVSTRPPVTITTTTPPGCPSGPRVNLGLWEYQGNRPPLPPPAGPCEAIVAHGDLDNSGTCTMRTFRQGEALAGLGNGTFRLVKVVGSPTQIDAAAAEIRRSACGY